MKQKYYLTKSHYYDTETRLVYNDDNICNISLKQLQLLSLLIQYQGKVCPYDVIYSTIWDEEKQNNKSSLNLRALIFNLKRSIPGISIKSYSSIGYILYL